MPGQLVIENRLGNENCREHIGDQPDDQRHSESADRPLPEQEQEGARHHGGDVGVDNGPPRFVETRIHGRDDGLAGPQLLADTLENQYVRIDRHANGQNDSGDSGQRQNGVEIGERRHQHNRVEHQRQDRIHAAAFIVDEHDNHYGQQSDDTSHETLMDGIGAQRWPDGALLEVLNARRQRTRPEVAREVHGLLFAAQPFNAAGIFDSGFDYGDADNIVVQNHGQLVADIGLGEAAKALTADGREREVGFPLPHVALTGPRVAHFPAGDYRGLTDQVPLLAFLGAARLGLAHLGIQRQHAAMLREDRFAAGERPVLDFGNFQNGRRADQFLDARRIVHARQLYQYLVLIARPPVLLHRWLRQPELVDAVADGLDGSFHRVSLERHQFGGLEPHRVVAGVLRSQHIGGIAVVDDAAEGARLGGRDALDVDLDVIGILNPRGIVAIHAGPGDALLAEILLEALHGLVGIRFDGVLYLDLEHQVAAALEVQPKLDVVLHVLHQVGRRLGETDNAEHAKQNRGHNHHGSRS